MMEESKMKLLDKRILVVGTAVTAFSILGCERSGEYGATPSTGKTAGTSGDRSSGASSAESASTVGDTTITGQVKAALLKEPDIKSTDIHVETQHGVVQLSGFVNNQAQIDKAASVANTVDGVKSVENKLSVKE